MFEIPVWDLLASYTGDSKTFAFSGEVFDGFYEDIRFLAPLSFQIRIMALDDAIEVFFDSFATRVEYEWKKHTVSLSKFERTWKMHIDPMLDGDDVGLINAKNMSIDLAPVIREEIIMATHSI